MNHYNENQKDISLEVILIKKKSEDDTPLYIIRRRLHIKNSIILYNTILKEEKRKFNRKYVMIDCNIYTKINKIKINEIKNIIYNF
jgi:hypothetical protein